MNPPASPHVSSFRRACSVLAIAGALLACADSTSPEDLRGTWGSSVDGVLLTITISDATFLAPCYIGKPTLPFLTSSGGDFHTNGVLTFQGGPGGSTQRIVDFAGTLHGNQMTLTVDPGAEQLGPYTLQRDVQVQVPGCN
jgi:hypothetical protein